MNEGIFTASASKQRKIFSQVTRAKKEIFKNASKTIPAVKEEKQMPLFQQLRSLHKEPITISVVEADDAREYDYEGDMSKSQLRSIIANAQTVHDMLEDNTNMAEWVQSKITLAADYISTVADYMQSEVNEAVTVKKANYSWGKMMTVHHGSNTSYPLHPEHQSAIKKLRPGMKTTFKDETNSTVHAHREGDTVHLTRPKTGSTVTALPYHHFDTSEHAKPVAKKPAGEYDRKVTDHLKKKYNEETEQMDELNKDTVISYAAKAEKDVDKRHKDLTAQIKSNNPLSANKTADKIIKRYSGMDRAETRLNKEANENPCWDGYKMLGMKDKGGKKVPNCIPEEQHYCAKHVYSNMFGEGLVVEGIHADPDEEGNVEWYAVQFNEGIKKVFTEKLEVMIAEFHGNHTKKKPKR